MIRKIVTLFVCGALAASAMGADATAEKVCASKECAQKCAGECPIEAALAKLPQLTFVVGSEKTCCAESAAKLAAEHSEVIQFAVQDNTYETEAAATLALADVTEKFVSQFATPAKCEVSGKFTVAGKELCCEVMAGERAAVAKAAMEKVAMTFVVGDKACDCPVEAASLAKQLGQPQTFVIAGEKTCCNVDARLKLARAKYKAAVEALAKVDATTVAATGDAS